MTILVPMCGDMVNYCNSVNVVTVMEKLEDFEEIDLGFESSTVSLLDHGDDHDHDHETTTLNLTLSRRSFAYYRTSSEALTFFRAVD
ncbi:hypothetical protein Tco_1093018 [Tanacetum coccineum]|uniref:Uncharacterized protein n=1 Tax=Tanacetum coccineum TaxID=301880 RepID=A0ABQ5ICU0_9ASTR